jgi:hypothetical protein
MLGLGLAGAHQAAAWAAAAAALAASSSAPDAARAAAAPPPLLQRGGGGAEGPSQGGGGGGGGGSGAGPGPAPVAVVAVAPPPVVLTVASFAVTKMAYVRLTKIFREDYMAATGVDVRFRLSFTGSGVQVRGGRRPRRSGRLSPRAVGAARPARPRAQILLASPTC